MSDTVQIDVSGDRWDEALSLEAWLRRVPGLLADVTRRPVSEHINRFFAPVTVRVTSTLAAQGLPQALAEWLATRKSAVTLRISYADGEVVELQGGTPVEEVVRRIEPALASLGPEPEAVRFSRVAVVPGERLRARLVEERLMESFDVDPALASRLAEMLLQGDLRAFHEARRRWDESRRHAGDPVSDSESDESAVPTLPVTVYLSEEGIHGQVESAVNELLGVAGLRIESRDEPVIGSWFRQMRAAVEEAVHSPAAREGALVAAHAADTRLVLAQDAAVTATLLQNLGPVIASLQPTKDAVLRVGALLIVKVDWAVNVFQLTAAQQAKLDHQPRLAVSPHEIIAALDLTPAGQADDGSLSLE
jgi:hypothetical protein